MRAIDLPRPEIKEADGSNMQIGGTELLVIFLVILVVWGPERTTLYARKLGKWLRVAKVYVSSMTEELKETVAEPLSEIQEPLKQITKPLETLTSEITDTMNDVSKPLADVSRDVRRSVDGIRDAAVQAGEKPAGKEPQQEDPDTLEMAEFLEETK